MSNLNVKEIIKKFLKENGYDGLYDEEGECGCELDDLMPCDTDALRHCLAGYKRKKEDFSPEEQLHLEPDDADFYICKDKKKIKSP